MTRRPTSRRAVPFTAVLVACGALSGVLATPAAGGSPATSTTPTTAATPAATATAATAPAGAGAAWGTSAAAPCDGLDPTECLLPFPNDYYTTPDRATVTGRRVDLPPDVLPRTAPTGAVTTLGTTPYAGNDGFSPGSSLLTHVPGISLARSRVATISDMGASLDKDSPVVVIDTTTGARWPTWAELDVTDTDASTRLLMIHPAKNFAEGDHYVVALRDLKTASGRTIPPGPCFSRVLGASDAGCTTVTAAYVAHLRGDLATLARYGVSRTGLFLAWDFTVASRQDLTAPALAMRNEAFATLGKKAPSYTITKVVDNPKALPGTARQVSGTVVVPSFLTGTEGTPGTVLTEGKDGLPVQVDGHTQTARFDCEIPKSATVRRPAMVGYYGHGLFNSMTEVYQSWVPQFSAKYDYVFCATNWEGLSSSTLALSAGVVSTLSEFPSLADNLMQSLVDAQFVGRLLDSPDGLAANPAFEGAGHRPLILAGHGLVYYGNSEGGIMGGAFTALSTDARRSVLGVPGMDYDVLLDRSEDFAPFLVSLNSTYPSKAEQQIGFDVIQMLWDRAEADGYAEQMTGGLPGTPSHQVMLEETYGDHQVANVQTETEARTIGAAVRTPVLAPGRSNERQPFWDLPALKPGSAGPALTVWDSGVPSPPLTDTPPTKGPDPHDTTPRSLPRFWAQMNTFFRTGRVTNTCGTGPCRAPYP